MIGGDQAEGTPTTWQNLGLVHVEPGPRRDVVDLTQDGGIDWDDTGPTRDRGSINAAVVRGSTSSPTNEIVARREGERRPPRRTHTTPDGLPVPLQGPAPGPSNSRALASSRTANRTPDRTRIPSANGARRGLGVENAESDLDTVTDGFAGPTRRIQIHDLPPLRDGVVRIQFL